MNDNYDPTSSTERAWAAGLLDGRGNLYFGTRRYPMIVLTIPGTGPDDRAQMAQRFDNATGNVGHIYGPYSSTGQVQWKCQSGGGVSHVLILLGPYLTGDRFHLVGFSGKAKTEVQPTVDALKTTVTEEDIANLVNKSEP